MTAGPVSQGQGSLCMPPSSDGSLVCRTNHRQHQTTQQPSSINITATGEQMLQCDLKQGFFQSYILSCHYNQCWHCKFRQQMKLIQCSHLRLSESSYDQVPGRAHNLSSIFEFSAEPAVRYHGCCRTTLYNWHKKAWNRTGKRERFIHLAM